MPKHPCRWPTCGTLLDEPGYCPRHDEKRAEENRERWRRYDELYRDRESKKFYDSEVWKATRKNQLELEPICQVCSRAVATEVHHDVPIRVDRSKSLDINNNLVSVCSTCHKRIEARRLRARQKGRMK